MLMQLNAWMCIKEWKKLTKKKWKSEPLLNCWWRISLYVPDITDKCFEGAESFTEQKRIISPGNFFFLQWTAPDSFEPCQDMRHTPSPSQLLPPRDAPLLIVKKLGNMIYSAAAITVDMLSVAPRTREKIIGSDGGLIPVRKKMLLQTESWFMNACWCGIYFLSGEGKRSIRANVLSERLCISLAVVQNRAFSGIVIICDKVR